MFTLINQDILKNVEQEAGVMLGLADSAPASYDSGTSVLCARFDGVNTALDFIKENMPEPKREKCSSSRDEDGGFYTFQTYEDCFDTFRFNPHKLKRDKDIDGRLTSPESSGNKINYDYTGDYIDMGRYVDGEPECFGTMTYGRIEKRVRLVYAFSATAHVDPKVIHTKSTRISQLVDWLEANGIRTEILAVESSGVGHMEVQVKRFEDRFVYNDLLVTTHPDFLRRIFFRVAEYSPSWKWGYGSSISCSRMLEKYVKSSASPFEYANNEHTIYFSNEDVNEDRVESVEKRQIKAKEWLNKVLPDRVDTDDQMALYL